MQLSQTDLVTLERSWFNKLGTLSISDYGTTCTVSGRSYLPLQLGNGRWEGHSIEEMLLFSYVMGIS